MARNSADTREKLLDAFDRLLEQHGTAGATLDAVAAEAGVSKGGLLYHFGSKAKLMQGSLDRLRRLVDADIAAMRSSELGPHIYYLETSAEMGTPLDQEHDEARVALRETREQWFAVLNDHLGDPHLAMTIQLIGDGMYLNQNFGLSESEALVHVKDVLARLGL